MDSEAARSYSKSEEDADVRKGPWTEEEDALLVQYISIHGEGHWNSLARLAGLRRTGKSCRLRWLNYLRPDVRRGNISLQEQLLILELHSLWGNRWSKIAQHLPGRTDNEIKNYWRTRVQKQAKHLKCDVNSQQFRDTLRHIWMPRLVERIREESKLSADESAPHHPVPTAADLGGPVANTDVRRAAEFGHNFPDPVSGFFSGYSSDLAEAQASSMSEMTDWDGIWEGNQSGHLGYESDFWSDFQGSASNAMMTS